MFTRRSPQLAQELNEVVDVYGKLFVVTNCDSAACVGGCNHSDCFESDLAHLNFGRSTLLRPPDFADSGSAGEDGFIDEVDALNLLDESQHVFE